MPGKSGPSETTPLPLTALPRPMSQSMETARIIFYGTLMISLSVGVINFNKYLIGKGIFPFPMHLVLFHTAFGSILSFFLILARPSLFPSLTIPDSKVTVDRELIVGKVLPIAFVSASNLVLSNMAYLHSSLAFLQMMKEANVVFVYLASLVVGLEVFKTRSCTVLVFIMLATMADIKGELHFSLVGFLIQASSQVFEVVKLVLQSIVLSGQHLDSLSYVLLVMPPSCLFVCVCVILRSRLDTGLGGSADLATPTLADVQGCWHLLLLNAAVVYFLNVSIALFMKHTSAVAMVLAGLVKDTLVVITSVVLLGEMVSCMQQVGFALQLSGVFMWSMVKRFPREFDEHGLFRGMQVVLFESKGCRV